MTMVKIFAAVLPVRRFVFFMLPLTLSLVSATAGEPMNYKTTPLTTDAEPMHPGTFSATWESLRTYRVPEWFRDAKFGIWAHWGPQCEPEFGDWYARFMYMPNAPEWGRRVYPYHVANYGHPSKVGFKDVIHQWKAQDWDPDALVALYKQAGARYFMALANHHDNFDLWDSKHQPWNSVNMGPKRDLIAGWAAAARKQGLRFGVSVHAAHAWTFYEPAQGADTAGPLAGVPYDGKLTKADGKRLWWEGYDPQDLYVQDHTPSPTDNIGAMWTWQAPGMTLPTDKYCQSIYDRTIDLINHAQPDLMYFDDTVLPMYPISDVGLKLAAHFYNSNLERHGGRNEGVIFGKDLSAEQKQALVWDIERGQSDKIEPQPWQTCTCLGNWHYDRPIFEQHRYRSSKDVIHMLVDIVSKNGNLLLNVPVRGDGTIDEDELRIVNEIGAWLKMNGQSIYETRPWKVFGEGPSTENQTAPKGPGFNEGKNKPSDSRDIRFTRKGNVLYAIVLGWPTEPVQIRSLGAEAGLLDGQISSIELLGSDERIAWSRQADAVVITPPQHKPCEAAIVFKIVCGI